MELVHINFILILPVAQLPVTNIEIIEIINKLSPNKSTGPFSIPVVLLKFFKNYISYPLEILFNCSFTSGIVPDHFKVAKVIPVYWNCIVILSHCYLYLIRFLRD